jgi:hypothetical protein
MNHSYACVDRLKRGGERDRPALHLYRARKTAGLRDDGHTEKNVHQGGFAGPVLSDQAQYLAGVQSEIDALQDAVPEIFLSDPFDPQEREASFIR